MTSIITLPAGAANTTLAYVGQLFTDLWALVALAIGIPLAFYVIRGAIGLVRGRTRV